MPPPRRWLYLILLIALLLRLGWSLTRPGDPASLATLPDQVEYLSLAQNLLHAQTLSFHDPRFDQTVYAYRTPGYPAFLAVCGASPVAARVAQSAIDGSTVLATYLLARRLSQSSVLSPLLAAAFVALNPYLIYFTALLLTETLFVSCLAWSLYLCSVPRVRLFAIPLLVFATLVRPSGLALTILLPALAAWLNTPPTRTYLSRALRTALVAGAAALLLVLALFLWSERNSRILGQRIWLTTNEGITRYDGFNPAADGSSNQSFVNDIPRLKDMTEVERNTTLSDLAAQYVAGHPARVGELAVRKIARTWSPFPLSKEFGSARYVLVGALYTCPLFLLAILGLVRSPLPAAAKTLLVTPAIYFTVIHALSVGSLRYRLPAEPPLAILAASAVSLFLNNRQPATSD